VILSVIELLRSLITQKNCKSVLTSHLPTFNSDNVNNAGRALPTGVNTNPNTIETCTAACLAAGFPFAGAEFAEYVIHTI
jgi:hypothetical protein